MRKIIGYIKNLLDGEGPPDGTVDVHALPLATMNDPDLNDTQKELDLTKHTLGALDVLHLQGGSGSSILADSEGRFGWAMELSPGAIKTVVTPNDPERQWRLRLPDESAQVGKAFHSDIERLGWAAGKDCLIWGAIEGGQDPTTGQWTGDPLTTGIFGDWGITAYGDDLNGVGFGRVVIQKGIAFLGGVLFSVEAADLAVPVAGSIPAAASPNLGAQERWDLLAIRMVTDPASLTYGKQSFVIQEGAVGGGIPALTPIAGSRLMVIHALKMAAGASSYSQIYDLRQWDTPPTGTNVTRPSLTKAWHSTAYYPGYAGFGQDAVVNTQMAADEIILPLDSAYAGAVYVSFVVAPFNNYIATVVSQMEMQGRAVLNGPEIANDNYILNPLSGAYYGYVTEYAWHSDALGGNPPAGGPTSLVFPVSRVPSGAEGRRWHRARFLLRFTTTPGALIGFQTVMANFWPVP